MRSVNANLLEINQAKSRINQAKKEGTTPDPKDLELVKTEKQNAFAISQYTDIMTIEKFSYNTSISAFMIAVNELGQQKCRNKELLTDLVILIAPFAPHIAEELWAALGEQGSVCDAAWPKYDEQYLKENDMQLTISFNGKARFQMTFPVDTPNEEIQKQVLADEKSLKYLEGFNVLKVIIVPKKIVNVVLKK